MTTTSTSMANPSRGDQAPKVKIRSSCDRCRLKKIKCNQGKPSCLYCQSRGLPCEYSRSVRCGRPSKVRQGALQMQRHTITDNRHSGFPWTANMKDTCEDDTAMARREGPSSDMMLSPALSSLNSSPYSSVYLDAENSLFPTSMECGVEDGNEKNGYRSLPPASFGLDNIGHQPLCTTTPDDLSVIPPFPDHQYGPLPCTPCETPPDSTKSPHPCMSTAIRTLGALYCPSTMHESRYNPDEMVETPTIDQVLQINKEAIRSIAELLACKAFRDPNLPILLGLIYSKILTWYQAMFEIDDPNVVEHAIHPPLPRDSLIHRPFSVGTYKMDEDFEEIMKYQLVLKELHVMKKQVQIYRDEFSNQSNIPDSNRLTSSIYIGMTALLEARLRYTIEPLEVRLEQALVRSGLRI